MPILSGDFASGAIRYACTAAPLFSLNCHCRDCQRESGSAFVPVLGVRKAAFAVSQGSPRYFEVTADSGHATTRAFCGDCGSPLFGLPRSEEHTSELQSLTNLVCRLLLEKKKNNQ